MRPASIASTIEMLFREVPAATKIKTDRSLRWWIWRISRADRAKHNITDIEWVAIAPQPTLVTVSNQSRTRSSVLTPTIKCTKRRWRRPSIIGHDREAPITLGLSPRLLITRLQLSAMACIRPREIQTHWRIIRLLTSANFKISNPRNWLNQRSKSAPSTVIYASSKVSRMSC